MNMLLNSFELKRFFRVKDFFLNLTLISSVIFWLIVSWPINMSPDSLDIWSQIKENSFSNSHPVTYTLFVKFFSLNGRSLVIVSLVQLLLFSIAIYFTSLTINSNKKISKLITVLIVLIPTGGSFATTLWKDVPFTSFLLIGFSVLLNNRIRTKYIFAILFLTVGASFRHNGFFLLLVICVLIIIIKYFYNDVINYRLIVTLISSAFFSILLIQSLVKIMDAKPASEWLTWSPMLADLAYVASRTENTNSNEIHELVSTYSRDVSLERAADCTSVNGLIFSEGFDDSNLQNNLKSIQREYLKFLYNQPEIFSRLHLCRANSFIPPPFSSGPNYFYWTQLQIIQPNDFGLIQNSPIKLLRNLGLVFWDIWNENSKLLLWPGFFAFISLFCLTNFTSKAIPYWFVISWGSLLSLIPWSNAQDFRYAEFSYSIFLILIFSKLVNTFYKIIALFFQSPKSPG